MDQLSVYDVQSVSWKAVQDALAALPAYNHTVDWSNGSHFPWWVWLANTGVLRDVVNDGVRGVELEVANGNRCVVVHSNRGTFRVSRYGTRYVVTPPPRSYDR